MLDVPEAIYINQWIEFQDTKEWIEVVLGSSPSHIGSATSDAGGACANLSSL